MGWERKEIINDFIESNQKNEKFVNLNSLFSVSKYLDDTKYISIKDKDYKSQNLSDSELESIRPQIFNDIVKTNTCYIVLDGTVAYSSTSNDKFKVINKGLYLFDNFENATKYYNNNIENFDRGNENFKTCLGSISDNGNLTILNTKNISAFRSSQTIKEILNPLNCNVHIDYLLQFKELAVKIETIFTKLVDKERKEID